MLCQWLLRQGVLPLARPRYVLLLLQSLLHWNKNAMVGAGAHAHCTCAARRSCLLEY